MKEFLMFAFFSQTSYLSLVPVFILLFSIEYCCVLPPIEKKWFKLIRYSILFLLTLESLEKFEYLGPKWEARLAASVWNPMIYLVLAVLNIRWNTPKRFSCLPLQLQEISTMTQYSLVVLLVSRMFLIYYRELLHLEGWGGLEQIHFNLYLLPAIGLGLLYGTSEFEKKMNQLRQEFGIISEVEGTTV